MNEKEAGMSHLFNLNSYSIFPNYHGKQTRVLHDWKSE